VSSCAVQCPGEEAPRFGISEVGGYQRIKNAGAGLEAANAKQTERDLAFDPPCKKRFAHDYFG
jgi:hypothetical protein